MKFNPTRFAVVDKDSKLKFPNEIKDAFYPTPREVLRVETGENEVQTQHSNDHLAHVYLEPTNRCNLEDCFGNSAPACGGCLWAQGLIQCP
ncbi:MAG: hypothetical protein A2Y88_12875 [Chloroflexi bacterium RBG_13_48_10]|nr:MAG: hypothetical protein A2Y88_12875 [Chloroflexi bacterium RBG_13_48_10]